MARQLHIHIHTPMVRRVTRDKKVVYDADQPTPFEELVQRLMELLAQQEGTATKDDAEPGHPFYGNQYTKVAGMGEKPTSATSKGVKNIVHELLSSGHPFSFEELKAATGAKLDQQLHNAISELKSGKHKAGALSIVKVGKGQYQVVNEKGEPQSNPIGSPTKAENPAVAPVPQPKAPTPPAQAPDAPVEVKAEDPFAGFTLPQPTPEDKAANALNGPHDALKGGWTLNNGVPTPPDVQVPKLKMDKALADTHYKQHIQDTTAAVVEAYHAHGEETAAQVWKEGKAQAMAQWATNHTGTLHKAKPVEVFAEDKELVKKLALIDMDDTLSGSGIEEAKEKAIAQWKQDTAKAKSTPKPTPQPEAKKEEPEAEPKKEEASKAPAPKAGDISPFLPVPKAIVPDDHKHIDVDDFAGGPLSNSYAKNINAQKSMMVADSASAVQNKINLAKKIDEKLKASPHFQEVQEAFKKAFAGGYDNLPAKLISHWAGSSGGNHPGSCSVQLCIRDAFGMGHEEVSYSAFHALHKHGKGQEAEDKLHREAAANIGYKADTPEKLETYKKAMRDFAAAQYHNTQDYFKEKGITHLHLVRGMSVGESGEGGQKARKVKVKMQPASSFSNNHGTALEFSKGASMFAVKVPVSQVLGSYLTGFGCSNEHEVVVLGHKDMEAVQVGYQHSPTQQHMVENIQASLGASAATKAPASKQGSAVAAKKEAAAAKPKGTGKKPTLTDHFGSAAGAGSLAKKIHNAAKAGDLEALKSYHTLTGALNPKTHALSNAWMSYYGLQPAQATAAPAVQGGPTPSDFGILPKWPTAAAIHKAGQSGNVTGVKQLMQKVTEAGMPSTYQFGMAWLKHLGAA